MPPQHRKDDLEEVLKAGDIKYMRPIYRGTKIILNDKPVVLIADEACETRKMLARIDVEALELF